eukprot:scaffold2431_cov185-Ochromonas_danica.AAC.2
MCRRGRSGRGSGGVNREVLVMQVEVVGGGRSSKATCRRAKPDDPRNLLVVHQKTNQKETEVND